MKRKIVLQCKHKIVGLNQQKRIWN